jgi:hypothetical protein
MHVVHACKPKLTGVYAFFVLYYTGLLGYHTFRGNENISYMLQKYISLDSYFKNVSNDIIFVIHH